MFKKILIVYSEKLTKKHLETVEKVKKMLNEKICCEVRADHLAEENFKDIDLVITIGGDGAFIRASQFLENQLIIGINSEPEFSEGALTSIDETELDFLNKILEGKYNILKRERIKVKLNNKELKELALNEIYVGSAAQFHTSRYLIKFNGKEEEQRSSGVLITTSCGSNAWFKSAGGTPFNEKDKLKFLVREPYFGNKVFKPKILTGEIKKGEKIEFEGKRHNGGIVAINADKIYDFNLNDKVEVELSDRPLNVIVKNTINNHINL